MNPNKPDGCPRCGWSAIRWQEYKAKQEALERENKELRAIHALLKESHEKAQVALIARAEKAEAELRDYKELVDGDAFVPCKTYDYVDFQLGKAREKLAAIEKDLREIMNGLYNSDEGWLAVNPSEIYDELHGLLGKHFPDKKAVGKRKEDE